MQMEWFDHSGQIVHAISELLELHSLIDVTLAADGKQIKVHRLILAAASDYFRELLTMSMEQLPIVYLENVSFRDLELLVQFIYSGKADIPSSHLNSFLSLASSLGIKGFTENHRKTLSELDSNNSSGTNTYKPRTPTKRKLMDDFAKANMENNLYENLPPSYNSFMNSPNRHTLSEPVSSDSNKQSNFEKKRKLQTRSMDEEINKVRSSDESLNKSISKDEDFLFKRPLPPPPLPSTSAYHTSTNSCPVKNVSRGEERPNLDHVSNSNVDNKDMDNNLSFDATTPFTLDPNDLAAKGATLLHHLAHWMLEEKRFQERMKQENNEQVTTNTTESNVDTSVQSSCSSSHTFPPGGSSNSRGRNTSGAVSNPRRSNSEGGGDTRPDSGFDSKDEGAAESLTTPTPPPPQVAPPTIREDSSGSSPEGGEILRKAPIRQPVLRKRRINNS